MRAGEGRRGPVRRELGGCWKRLSGRNVLLCRLGSARAYPAKGCQAGVRSRFDGGRNGLWPGIHFVYGGEGGARAVLAVGRAWRGGDGGLGGW